MASWLTRRGLPEVAEAAHGPLPRSLLGATLALAIAATAAGCRQEPPSGDPKTPANSPFPRIDQPEEPSGSPSPLKPDAGATLPVPSPRRDLDLDPRPPTVAPARVAAVPPHVASRHP